MVTGRSHRQQFSVPRLHMALADLLLGEETIPEYSKWGIDKIAGM